MNCATKMQKILGQLANHRQKNSIPSDDLYTVRTECKEDWNKDYALIYINIDDSDYYRDTDRVIEDVVEQLKNYIGSTATVVRGTKSKVPDSGYVMHIHPIEKGMSLEIELYSIEGMAEIVAAEKKEIAASKMRDLRSANKKAEKNAQ